MEDSTILILGVALLAFSIFFLCTKIKHNSLLREDVGQDDLNSDLPVKRQNASVLSKIEPENPNSVFFGLPHIIFEADDHERIKLAITDRRIYDDILVGDFGVLETKGRAFIHFTRGHKS